MKKAFQIILLVAAFLATASCSSERTEEETLHNMSICIPTGNDTRTAYDNGHIKWLSTDRMALNLTADGCLEASISIAADGKATFSRSATIATEGWYKAQGVVPVTAFIQGDSDIDSTTGLIDGYALKLPSEQSCTGTSFDPAADILVSEIVDFEVRSGDIVSGKKTVKEAFRYTRPFAIARLTFTKANDAYSEDNVNSVTIRFSDYCVAGSARQFDIKSCTFLDSEGKTIKDIQDAFYKDASHEISVSISDHPKVRDLVLWLSLAPVNATSGTMYVTIDTDAHSIEKTIDLASHNLKFEKDCLNTAAISLSTSTTYTKKEYGAYMGCMEMPSVNLESTTSTFITSSAAYGREQLLSVNGQSTQKIVVHEFDDYGSTSGASSGTWYRNYTMLYDNSMYAALWIAYSLSDWHFPLSSSISRPSTWYADPAVTQYSGGYEENTTYDRGHQCANMTRNKCSKRAQLQTFFHSNQTPQINKFNQGQWNALENKEMAWYKECDTMYVTTGPIFDPGYRTTNDKEGTPIPVPTRYFKAFLKCSWQGGELTSVKAIGFIMDNSSSASAYTKSVASISEIETQTGFHLFANLPDAFSEVRNNSTPSAFTSNW